MTTSDTEELTAENLTPHVIKVSTDNVKHQRLRELITNLIQHLHDYVREVQLTTAEWNIAIRYLTQVGHESTPDRQEMILLSDVLGVSALVDTLNSAQAKADAATESSVLGPFHSEDTHTLANGQSIGSPGVVGELMIIYGTVKSVSGEPIEGVAVDIWETNGNGFYDMQDPNRDGPDCRGIFHTDNRGRYFLVGVKSVDYDLPTDGSVGVLLSALRRNITRPAHVLKHPDYVDLTTALYMSHSQHIATDPVFGVKKTLVKRCEWTEDPTTIINEYHLEEALRQMKWDGGGVWTLNHEFVLLPNDK